MFLLRRCKLPSAKLAAGVLLLWSVVAGTAWVGLAAGFNADQTIKHAGPLAYFILFSAAIPAIIHYAILRRGSTLRMERATLIIIGAISITAIAGKAFQLHRENRIIRSLYYEWDKEFMSQWEALRKEQRNAEMVFLLEQKCDSYRKEVAALGGLQELVRIAGRPRFAIADGTSDLFCGMHRCIDYNAAFTPMNVEFVLMEAMPYQSRNTPRLQALATQLSQSREPLLKAYGLWMLDSREEYRDFVYQHAEHGELWSYGFAADAANDDPDPQRALAMLDRYVHELVHGPHFSDTPLHYLDYQIATTAGKLGDVIRDTSPRQRALIHRMLDRQLTTREGNPHTPTASLFTLMGRPDDAKRYLARIKHNHDQYFRAYMIEMLLEKMLLKHLNPDTLREMHQILDEHLKTGNTPGITTEQMQRIFKVLGRSAEIEGENR